LVYPATTIAVIGTASSGKSLVSQSLASKYNLGYISIDDTITEWSSDWEKNLSIDICVRIYDKLKQGGSVDSATYVELIQYLVSQHKSTVRILMIIERMAKLLDGFLMDFLSIWKHFIF
jgi:adenylate kinase family enzyme